MTTQHSIFTCIECGKEYDIREISYRCECGELLEVLHDFDAYIPKSKDWKASLNEHMRETAFHRYQDILFPLLPKESIYDMNNYLTYKKALPNIEKSYENVNNLTIKKGHIQTFYDEFSCLRNVLR